jgi:hypothetical protein
MGKIRIRDPGLTSRIRNTAIVIPLFLVRFLLPVLFFLLKRDLLLVFLLFLCLPIERFFLLLFSRALSSVLV